MLLLLDDLTCKKMAHKVESSERTERIEIVWTSSVIPYIEQKRSTASAGSSSYSFSDSFSKASYSTHELFRSNSFLVHIV